MAYSYSDPDIFGEQDTLELNDDKVDELLNIIKEAFKRLLSNREVLSGANRRGEPVTKENLSGNLSQSSD
jgi:hypothetical protein